MNLINNAIKFTFKGNVTVKVKMQSLNDEQCDVVFSVTDEGVGIPKEKQNLIFEVFSQADASTTRRFGGTGLGLSISKRLVEMMNGRIWVESEELKGSTFYFTAIFQSVKETTAVVEEPTSEHPAKGTKVLKPLSILLAEDNIINQKIVVRILEKRGWKVSAAENGKEALNLLEKGPFDLILMDAQMPILDGFETTRLIRENEKKTGNHIPIIALTWTE